MTISIGTLVHWYNGTYIDFGYQSRFLLCAFCHILADYSLIGESLLGGPTVILWRLVTLITGDPKS